MQNTIANIYNIVHPKHVVCIFANGNCLHLKFNIADDGNIITTS